MEIADLFMGAYGLSGAVMDNGEGRLRLSGVDYILTRAGEVGAWQNAHLHGGDTPANGDGVRELYMVQTKWMAFVTQTELGPKVEKLGAGSVVMSEPGQAHNVYLPTGAVIHTFKFGKPVGNPAKNGVDWWPASEPFDTWTKSLSEEDIAFLAV